MNEPKRTEEKLGIPVSRIFPGGLFDRPMEVSWI
jgi:hypothetical protein